MPTYTCPAGRVPCCSTSSTHARVGTLAASPYPPAGSPSKWPTPWEQDLANAPYDQDLANAPYRPVGLGDGDLGTYSLA